MKKQILKIAGVKSEKEFYKKFPTEEAFMAKHGKELKKAQIGAYMTSESASTMYQPVDVRGIYDEIDYQLTGMTAADRAQIEAAQQAAAQQAQPAQSGGAGGGGIDMSQIAQVAQMAAAKKGKKVTKSQRGDEIPGLGPTGPQLTPSAQNLQQQQSNWGTNYNPSAVPAATATATTKKPVNWAQGIPIVGKIVGGIQKSKEAKKLLQQTIQQEKLTDVMGQAAASRPVQQPRRQYVRPEDMAFQPEQMFPSYGVGTNVLAEFGASVGGGEIMNTYAPGTLYDNLGYEPLNDSERYKQFYHGGKMHKAQGGFETFMNQQGGNEIFGAIDQLGAFNDGGGDIGSGIGEAVGSIIPIPGAKPVFTALGRIAGSALDQKQEKTEASQKRRTQNINKIAGQNFGIGIQQQFGSMLRNGGYAQLGESVGADCVKKGTCKAEESREKGYSSLEKASRAADIAGAKLAALEAKQIKQQNRADYADYINERLTGYGDKLKQKEFDAAYEAFAAANPELAKDRLLYTVASKELPKLRSNKEYYLRNVLGRTSPGLGYDTLSLPGLMQAMQKGYGGSQGYLEAWNRGFRQQQDGGTTSPYEWVSHTWQPQVIATFGEHKVKDLLKPPHDADMLRAGGHLKEYTPPSAEAMSTERPVMQMGGELQTHWGGYAEPMSYNPYLPDGGETIMFRGQSHDESDGKGNTGIGITYGNNPVEVERGEPAVKLQDGGTGESNLTVFGNIKITNAFADMLADPKAKGKKFKTYVADLSKQENKQNKLMDKSIDQLDDLDVQTSFDKLALGTLQANIEGANAKLKDLADKKINAASLQNAINDTKEENLLDVTDKGDVLAKKGASIPKAQKGLTARADVPKQSKTDLGYGNISKSNIEQMKANNPWYDWSKFNPAKPEDVLEFQQAFNRKAEEVGSYARLQEDSKLGKQTVSARGLYTDRALTPLPRTAIPNLSYTLPKPSASPSKTIKPVVPTPKKFDWMTAFNQLVPYLRPSDAEALDSNQLLGEMYALATNQLEPVQAQTFQPQLSVPYDISLQDILNENEASFRSQQRLMGYNPAAQGMLNAQKYQANQKVLAEQFRLNQAEKQRVYEQNRNLLNQAQLQNLGILDQQYVRQAQALSNTKATTQAALNSIASKYAQNKLENRTLATYENLYNYRYDPRFRAINMNPLAQWDTTIDGVAAARTPQAPEGYEYETVLRKKKKDSDAKNGAILKAVKNL